MSKWLAVGLLALFVGVVLLFLLRSDGQDAATGDAETQIVAYLKENIKPGQPVLVTELYNSVFTSPEEREALQRLYDAFFRIPAYAAEFHTKSGKIPTLKELSDQFQFKVPGEIDVLLRIMESDPRVPMFFERDRATGEITRIHVDRIASDERFGRTLRTQ